MASEEYVFSAMAALGFPDIDLPLIRLTEELGKLCKNAQVKPPTAQRVGTVLREAGFNQNRERSGPRLWYYEDRPHCKAWKREEFGARAERDDVKALKRFEELLNFKRAARSYDTERDLSSIYE